MVVSVEKWYHKRMSIAERIAREIGQLPPEEQSEVLDFVEFLKQRKARNDDAQFKEFSLNAAMRGMEEEAELYGESDIHEPLK